MGAHLNVVEPGGDADDGNGIRRGFGVLLSIAYSGRGYCGFARQPDSRTIAGAVDGAVRSVDPKASLIRAVSRTDSGVHARDQRASFDTALDIASKGWVHALNRHLPEEIVVLRAAHVPVGFDPRDHAVSKIYRYTVLCSAVRDPFRVGTAWRVADRLNHALMLSEAQCLMGTHDFRAFRSAADERINTTRTLRHVALIDGVADPRCLEITIEGDRFLHRMVRIIVGTLIDVGRGRLEPGAISRALASGSRNDLGITAPPDGLCLESVVLGEDGRDPWPTASA